MIIERMSENIVPYSNLKYRYSEDNCIFVTPSTANKNEYQTSLSKFDSILRENWNYALKNGYMRYQLDHIKSRFLGGKYNFLCQLNVKRATNRRPPQTVTSVDMPFNPAGFNFTKIKNEEVLLHMMPSWKNSSDEHLIVVNVSPFEYGNSLLVPSIRDCLPQVMKEVGIRLAIEVILLSSNPALRAGFNGLTAQASVNHLHFHIYYLNHRLFLETAETRRLHGNCFELVEYPAQGFAFQITEPDDIELVTKSVMRLIHYFMRNSIAHNIFLTRGSKFEDAPYEDGTYSAVRVYVWAREGVIGQKVLPEKYFVPACIELAGHIPLKDQEFFESIREEDVVSQLRETCVDYFEVVKKDIEVIFTDL